MVLYSPHLSEVALSRNRRSRAAWAHTAVASIPRPGGCRDYLFLSAGRLHVLRMHVHEAGEWGKHHDAGFYPRRDFAWEP